MNKFHQEILERIKSVAHPMKIDHLSENYSGSKHPSYFMLTADARAIAKGWSSEHKDIELSEFLALLDSLAWGESIEEKQMIGKLLGCLPVLRAQIEPKSLNTWLGELEGWAEIDSLCQSVFSEEDLLANWPEWEKTIRDFARDGHISRRRASLVLLTWSVVHSDDQRLKDLALENIDRLKGEKNILITKAVSWLLRSLVERHRGLVEDYIEANGVSLPKIALRETRNKIKTGKK